MTLATDVTEEAALGLAITKELPGATVPVNAMLPVAVVALLKYMRMT